MSIIRLQKIKDLKEHTLCRVITDAEDDNILINSSLGQRDEDDMDASLKQHRKEIIQVIINDKTKKEEEWTQSQLQFSRTD